MRWSWKAIGYWAMLWTTFLLGLIFTVSLLVPGLALLWCYKVYSRDRKCYPLKTESAANPKIFSELSEPEKKTSYYPMIIELGTDMYGRPVKHADGTPSNMKLKAVQINQLSYKRDKDYEKTFFDSKTGEIFDYDGSKPDHLQLYVNFLGMISQPEFSPRPYMDQYNIIDREAPGAEKNANTVH